MTVYPITINLTEQVYRQIKRAADSAKRPMSEMVSEAVTAVAPVIDSSSGDLRAAMMHMAYLNDAALWTAARTTLTPEQRVRLEMLHDKQQREGLTSEGRTEEQALIKLYRETQLVRAQAVALLKQRGYDVSDASQFHPLN